MIKSRRQKHPLITIFNGRVIHSSPRTYAQVDLRFRQHLELFRKGNNFTPLAVFMSIALRADANGWAVVTQREIAEDLGGMSLNAMVNQINQLLQTELPDGTPVLAMFRTIKGIYWNKTLYHIFPSSGGAEGVWNYVDPDEKLVMWKCDKNDYEEFTLEVKGEYQYVNRPDSDASIDKSSVSTEQSVITTTPDIRWASDMDAIVDESETSPTHHQGDDECTDGTPSILVVTLDDEIDSAIAPDTTSVESLDTTSVNFTIGEVGVQIDSASDNGDAALQSPLIDAMDVSSESDDVCQITDETDEKSPSRQSNPTPPKLGKRRYKYNKKDQNQKSPPIPPIASDDDDDRKKGVYSKVQLDRLMDTILEHVLNAHDKLMKDALASRASRIMYGRQSPKTIGLIRFEEKRLGIPLDLDGVGDRVVRFANYWRREKPNLSMPTEKFLEHYARWVRELPSDNKCKLCDGRGIAYAIPEGTRWRIGGSEYAHHHASREVQCPCCGDARLSVEFVRTHLFDLGD